MVEITESAYQLLMAYATSLAAFTFLSIMVVCALTTKIIANYRAIYEIQVERVDNLANAVVLLNQQLSFLTGQLENEIDDGK